MEVTQRCRKTSGQAPEPLRTDIQGNETIDNRTHYPVCSLSDKHTERSKHPYGAGTPALYPVRPVCPASERLFQVLVIIRDDLFKFFGTAMDQHLVHHLRKTLHLSQFHFRRHSQRVRIGHDIH